MTDQSRGDRRYRMNTEARVTSGTHLVSDRALDVSATGLRVRALRDVHVGAPVEITLRIPGCDVWVEGEGEVTRRIEGRRSSDEGRAYGIRLRRMSSIARRTLHSVACWYEEAARTRGDRRDHTRAKERRVETKDGVE